MLSERAVDSSQNPMPSNTNPKSPTNIPILKPTHPVPEVFYITLPVCLISTFDQARVSHLRSLYITIHTHLTKSQFTIFSCRKTTLSTISQMSIFFLLNSSNLLFVIPQSFLSLEHPLLIRKSNGWTIPASCVTLEQPSLTLTIQVLLVYSLCSDWVIELISNPTGENIGLET
jgi:hypothetical protein